MNACKKLIKKPDTQFMLKIFKFLIKFKIFWNFNRRLIFKNNGQY